MVKNEEKEEIMPPLIVGDFGVVKTTFKYLPENYLNKERITVKTIQRYSFAGDLIAEVKFYSNLDNLETILDISPKYVLDELYWDITLAFKKIKDDYRFYGSFGVYGIKHFGPSIPAELYDKIHKKAIEEISNPNSDYGSESHSNTIDDIINWLREYDDREINKDFLAHWDIQIAGRQEQKFKKRKLMRL